MKTLYKNESYEFILYVKNENALSTTSIVRHSPAGSEEDIVLFDYTWSDKLRVEVEAEEGVLGEDGILRWKLQVTAHHISGMAQGEFAETEYFELAEPFGAPDEMVCRTVDIVRKTRFALAERHLKHLPNQTYPPVDGRQGPYGHP